MIYVQNIHRQLTLYDLVLLSICIYYDKSLWQFFMTNLCPPLDGDLPFRSIILKGVFHRGHETKFTDNRVSEIWNRHRLRRQRQLCNTQLWKLLSPLLCIKQCFKMSGRMYSSLVCPLCVQFSRLHVQNTFSPVNDSLPVSLVLNRITYEGQCASDNTLHIEYSSI